jgi:hypothetical protein
VRREEEIIGKSGADFLLRRLSAAAPRILLSKNNGPFTARLKAAP